VSVGDSIAKLKSAGGKLVSTYSGTQGNGLHDGDSWAYGSHPAGGTIVEVVARIKSGIVGSLNAPIDVNGS
jgi:hypothetical protein